jgi:hypothetical protein
MGSGLSLTPLTDDPHTLAVKLERCLPDHRVCELDGLVLVEHYRHPIDVLEADVRGALARIYGQSWREAVEGLD